MSTITIIHLYFYLISKNDVNIPNKNIFVIFFGCYQYIFNWKVSFYTQPFFFPDIDKIIYFILMNCAWWKFNIHIRNFLMYRIIHDLYFPYLTKHCPSLTLVSDNQYCTWYHTFSNFDITLFVLDQQHYLTVLGVILFTRDLLLTPPRHFVYINTDDQNSVRI